MNRYLGITLGVAFGLLLAITGAWSDDATLLPNAIQYFMDANGKPLANGKVYMYTPNSTTPKTTWTTAGKTVAQPQPFIPLGIAGKPASPIYGDGSYRQLVKDAAGNTIWDYNTASTGDGGSSGTTIGDGIAVGTILPFDGLVAPANYMFAYGQTISRTTYSALLSAITLTDSIVCTAGTNIISNFSSTKQLAVTMPVESSCLPPGTTITSVPTDTTTGMSNNATISGVFTIQVFPSGRGDGSTTFNLPDLRGRALAGRDNMGGTAAGRLTATYYGFSATGLAQGGGSQSGSLVTGNLPPYTPAGTIINGAITSTFTGTPSQAALTGTGGAQAFASGSFASQQVTGTVATTQLPSAFTGTAMGGTSTPFSLVQPTLTTNWIIKVSPDSLSSDATWQVPLYSVPVGRGTGTGFDSVANNASTTPKFLQQSGDGVNATAPLWGTVQQFVTTSAISGLRGLAAGISSTVYVQGYFAAGDGAEGTFYWDASSATADNACTIIRPNTLPATGRWIRQVGGTEYNVKWCGATGDGVTNDYAAINTTVGLAIASKGTVYLPSTAARYLINSTIVIPDNTHGLKIRGDVRAGGVASNQGAEIASTSSSVFDMTGVAAGGTGSISNIDISNLTLISTGASGRGLKIWNVDDIRLSNLTVDTTNGNAVDMAGTAHFSFNLVSMFSNGGCPFFVSQAAVGGQNIGPGFIDNSFVAITNDSFSAMCITNDPLGVEVRNLDINWVNSTGAAAIELNGPTPSAFTGVGSIKFSFAHAESTYNTTNTGKTFRVGNTNPFATLVIEGGNFWGQGNGTNYQQDWLQVVAARNVVVDGATVSKLASTNGFSRAMVRLESTFTGALSVRNPIADISGSTYSDARAVSVPCSGTGSCWSDGLILDALTLGAPLAATSGGTGFASFTIGDLFYADTTTTLARLADVATTNALISGGTGVAPSWGKIGNSTLTNSSTTVNGQTCTLGSTCTVTAAASGVTVGTTTVGGGTTTRILYDNAGVLGEYTISGSGTVVAMAAGPTLSGPTFTGTVTATGLIKNADLATMATNTVKGNATSGSASPTDLAVGTCSTAASALQWTTNTGFGCNTSITANTATTATNATNTTITEDVATNATMFPTWVTANTGNLPQKTTSTKLTFNPSTGVLSSTSFTGAGTGLTGTAASLTAGNVTTNANLTGAITSVGNAASLGSFSSANLSGALTDETGSGSAVFGTSPTLSTVDARGTWTTGTSWTLPALTFGGTITGGGVAVNNVALASSTYNGNSWTAGTGTLAIGAGKTATISNTLTLTGTDASSVAFGTGGTVGAVGYSATGQIAATATNDDAAAGKVGEYVSNVLTTPAVSSLPVTITIATPAVVTWTGHGLCFSGAAGCSTVGTATAVVFTTTGALPTGIVAGTTYYAVAIDANTFNIASSCANALAGTFIATSGSQSGTQTANVQVSLANNTVLDLACARFPAGDYDVRSAAAFTTAASTTVTVQLAGISLTSNTFDPIFGRFNKLTTASAIPNGLTTLAVPNYRMSFSSTTNVFFIGYSLFGVSTQVASGMGGGRRVR